MSILKLIPNVVSNIQKKNSPNCRIDSSFLIMSGKMCSVKNIQSGKESPARTNVKNNVIEVNLILSISNPFIPKKSAPAKPEISPGKKYLSKSKLIAARAVMAKIAVEHITITNVNPIFFFNGPSIFKSGSPRPKRIGTKNSSPVQNEIMTPNVAKDKLHRMVNCLFDVVMGVCKTYW